MNSYTSIMPAVSTSSTNRAGKLGARLGDQESDLRINGDLLDMYLERENRDKVPEAARSYSAFTSQLLTDMPTFSPMVAAGDLFGALTQIRAKARHLAQNDGYTKKFLTMIKNNVVGSDGFILQNKAMDDATNYDDYANTLIEYTWKEFGKVGVCDITGRFSFRDVCNLMLTTQARDGESIALILKGRQYGKYAFKIQMVEPDMLDESYTTRLPNGNIVYFGVEEDSYGKPVRYYFRKKPTIPLMTNAFAYSNDHDIVDASQVIHLFDPDRISQSRGISMIVQSIIRLQMIGGFEEASLTNARITAAKMGFFTSEAGGEYEGNAPKGPDGKLRMNVRPGLLEQLSPGLDFKQFSSEFPSSQHDMFIKSILRGVASGLGVSYNTLANDLEGVNYSSIRAGLLDERESWKSYQSFFIEHFLDIVQPQWLEMALLNNAINLPITKYDKFNKATWIGRRWAWVDPLKEVNAAIAAIDAGLKSRTQVMGEQGSDVEDVFKELSNEQKLAIKYGVTLKMEKTNGKANKSN